MRTTSSARTRRDIQGLRDDLRTYFNYYGHAGAETRALSALDIACWDLEGRAAGEPLYRLLGGKAREEIPTYNISYGQEYDFRTEPVALAESLLDQGVTSMKIWPFDESLLDHPGTEVRRTELGG